MYLVRERVSNPRDAYKASLGLEQKVQFQLLVISPRSDTFHYAHSLLYDQVRNGVAFSAEFYCTFLNEIGAITDKLVTVTMKYFVALTFVAVASALLPEPLDTAKAFAPIALTPEAVRVVDAPIHQTISRSELEAIRIVLPIDLTDVQAPIMLAQVLAPEAVRVVDQMEEAAPVAAEDEAVRVADSPLPVVAPKTDAVEQLEQVKVVEMPAYRPMPQYDNDMLR